MNAEPTLIETKSGSLVAAWMQDGTRGISAAGSTDSGATWSRSIVPFTRCSLLSASGGMRRRWGATSGSEVAAVDPWLASGANGHVYLIALVANADHDRAVVLATSRNSGRSWSSPSKLPDGPYGLPDKPCITADATRPETQYAGFTDGEWPLDVALFSKTRNAGRKWTDPRPIVRSATHTFLDNLVAGRRSGTLHALLTVWTGTSHSSSRPWLAVATSKDGGRRWGPPVRISPVFETPMKGPGGERLRTQITGDIAVDPIRGNLYVVWPDSRFENYQDNDILLSRSRDGGRHWSAPGRVASSLGAATFNPTIAVNPMGVVGISYYATRLTFTGQRSVPFDYLFISSRDAGVHFRKPRRVAGPFDFMRAPRLTDPYDGTPRFLGDYDGLTADREAFHALFSVPAPPPGPKLGPGESRHPTTVLAAAIQP